MKIKEYNQMKEELIKDDRGDSTGAFRNFVREQRALDPEPRNMELASGYGSSTFDAHKKREAAFKAYKEYKKSYYGSRQRNPILTFRQFLPIYAKENYAEGGRIGFNDGKNVFLNEGKKSKFTAGAETTVINGKEYVKITKLGNPNFGKYVYKTSVAAPGYGRSGKSKNEYLTYDQLVKRINKPKTGKAPFKSYTKEYTQSLKDIKAYVKSQGGAKKVYLSDLVEMFGDPTKYETGRDIKTETRIEKALGDDYEKLIKGGESKKITQKNKIKFNKLVRDVNRGDRPLIDLTQSKTNVAPNHFKNALGPVEKAMYEKLSPKFKAVLSRIIQPRQKYTADDIKNISEATTKTFNKMIKNYPLSAAARSDVFKSGTRFFNNKSYILGQIARHIGEGGDLYRHVSGDKMSDVKFRNNQTGRLITYNNIDITDPEFKEAATRYDEWDKIKNHKIDNPLKKGEKITIAKAMAAGGDNLVIDHLDPEGVKGNPLKNLAITNQKANMAGQIKGLTQVEIDAIGRGLNLSVEDNIKRYSSYGDKLLKQSAGDPNFKKPTPIETIIKKTGTLRGKAEAIKSKMDASRMFTSRIPGGAAVLAPADFVLSMVAGVPIYDAAASAGSYLLKDPYLGKAVNIPLALRAMTDYGDADEMLQKAQERKEKIESTIEKYTPETIKNLMDFSLPQFIKEKFAGGGMAGIRKPSAIPPESGPQSQGLASLKKYGSYY